MEKDLSFRACIKVLKKYPGANNIVVRMGYALGNLMARSESARVKVSQRVGPSQRVKKWASMKVSQRVGQSQGESRSRPESR